MTIASEQYSVQDLIEFEDKVAREFGNATINGPIHLCDPNQAEPLLSCFQMINDDDWVFASWRSHFHALLKGIPPDALFQMICEGRSMMIHSKAHQFFTSSIVAGTAPVALGVAQAIKMEGRTQRVYLFVGDMTACTGLYKEVEAYAHQQDLPLHIVVEDNNLSTNTPTREIFGLPEDANLHKLIYPETQIHYYQYNRSVSHVGIDKWVDFK